MRTIVIIIFCFAISSYAKPNPINIAKILTSVDADISAITSKCLKKIDFEALSGNLLACLAAKEHSTHVLEPCIATIGNQEMRKMLNFSAPRPWIHNTHPDPSPPTTIEEYYDLKEPISHVCSLDNLYVTEKNVETCIEYLDKKRPDIRAAYTKVFRSVGVPDVLDRPAVDRMVDVLDKMLRKFEDVMWKMNSCSDAECYFDMILSRNKYSKN